MPKRPAQIAYCDDGTFVSFSDVARYIGSNELLAKLPSNQSSKVTFNIRQLKSLKAIFIEDWIITESKVIGRYDLNSDLPDFFLLKHVPVSLREKILNFNFNMLKERFQRIVTFKAEFDRLWNSIYPGEPRPENLENLLSIDAHNKMVEAILTLPSLLNILEFEALPNLATMNWQIFMSRCQSAYVLESFFKLKETNEINSWDDLVRISKDFGAPEKPMQVFLGLRDSLPVPTSPTPQ